MKKWSFEEDYILCKVCGEHKYVFAEDELLDTLISKLGEAGFFGRSRSAVKKRAYNCIGLLHGRDMSSVPDLQKERCVWFFNRKQTQHISEELQSYINRNYVRNDVADLGAIATTAPNMTALLPIGSVGPTFQELLFIYISRLNTGDPEIYHRAQISRATFSNIRSGKKGVSKKTLKQLCFGLKLTYDEAVALMAAADCAFNPSDIGDLVVVYFLKNRIYDTYEVNAELYERKQPLLFSGDVAYYK